MTLKTLSFAKRLRQYPTDAERKLWGALRNRGLAGFKFYRQVPIGPYVVDFLNRETRLVLEVDGATHGDRQEHDFRRTEFLNRLGFAVYRVDNISVYRNIGATLDGIHAVLVERGANLTHHR